MKAHASTVTSNARRPSKASGPVPLPEKVQYHYREIGEPLYKELCEKVLRGESLILLGHQGAGRRHVLVEIGNGLKEAQKPYLWMFFKDHRSIHTEEELLAEFRERLKNNDCSWFHDSLLGVTTLEDWFTRIAETSRGSRLPISFANIDWIAKHLKETFLYGLWQLVEKGHLTVVLTCQMLNQRTLGKITSAFRCEHQYVLTGNDEQNARDFFDKRVAAYCLVFKSAKDPEWNREAAFKAFYQRTGGQINMLRAIIWHLSERRMRFSRQIEGHEGYGPECVKESFLDYSSVPLFELKFFHASKGVIQYEPILMERLEQLLDQMDDAIRRGHDRRTAVMSASLPVATDAPEMLELLGILKRNTETGRLHFLSYYVGEYHLWYFSWKCRGDFHAKQGNWERAFDCYSWIFDEKSRWRPSSETDIQILHAVINRLIRTFLEKIKEDTQEIKELFEKAMKFIFGVSAHVMRIGPNEKWVLDGSGTDDTHEVGEKAARLLQKKGASASLHDKESIYDRHLAEDSRSAFYMHRPGTPELPPRHGVLVESASPAPILDGLKLQLIEGVVCNFLIALQEARLLKHYRSSRLNLGRAVKTMFERDEPIQCLEDVGGYLKEEFNADGARLFLLNPATGDLQSAKSWGFKSTELQQKFDSGGLVLSHQTDPELMRCIVEKKALAFRWCPPQVRVHRPLTDLNFTEVTENDRHKQVERKKGDYWIDFPLLVGDEIIGKLTLAFPSYSPPPQRYMDDLETISAILSSQLGRLRKDVVQRSEQKTARQRAIAITAHDLASKITFLPAFLADYRDLEEKLPEAEKKELQEINLRFRERIESAKKTLNRAKEKLAEVRPTFERLDIRKLVNKILSEQKPHCQKSSGEPVWIEGDSHLLECVFEELISDSYVMSIDRPQPLRVRVDFEISSDAKTVVVLYRDNGPGVPPHLKERIFDYFVSYRPGKQKKGSGLGLGHVREVVHSHKGQIKETGRHGEGVCFEIRLPTHSS